MKIKGKVKKGNGSPKLVKKHYPDMKIEMIKGETETYTKIIKTANLDCKLKKGIYRGMTDYGGCMIMSLQDSHVANNDIDNQGYQNDRIDVHIMGWTGDLYGKELDVWDIIEIPWWRMCNDLQLNLRECEKKYENKR